MKKFYETPEVELFLLAAHDNMLWDSSNVSVYGDDNEIDDPFNL